MNIRFLITCIALLAFSCNGRSEKSKDRKSGKTVKTSKIKAPMDYFEKAKLEHKKKSAALRLTSKKAAGKLNGKPWTFVSGKAKFVKARPKFGIKQDQLEVTLYDVPTERCKSPKKAGPEISFAYTGKPSKVEIMMNPKNSVKFIYKRPDGGSHTAVATVGRSRLDSVGKTIVSGALVAEFLKDDVSGTFTVPLCPTTK